MFNGFFYAFLYFIFLKNALADSSHNMIPHGSRFPSGLKQSDFIELFDFGPKLKDLNFFDGGLYSGLWYSKIIPSSDKYTEDEYLEINLGGEISTIHPALQSGALPLISGESPFYVEVTYKISSNNMDHWAAVWMLPIEHSRGQLNSLRSDPPNYQRWFELDIDESGFGCGTSTTAHSWSGVWPNFVNLQNKNNISNVELDRTQWNSFGVYYDPALNKVEWYLNGRLQSVSGYPYVPSIAAMHHYYLIFSAHSHGANLPYKMKIKQVRAYQFLLDP